jgi:hypothetical protein
MNVPCPRFLSLLSCFLFLGLSQAGFAQDSVDLRSWGDESYPAVSGFGAGVWTVSGDGSSVVQSVNGQPTLFYSDFNAFNSELEGVISPGGGDDDYIGFALGFLPGDTGNPGTDYLLIDWKAGTQFYDFGNPSCTPGGPAPRGLAISRVRGVPTADEFWAHMNFDTPACSGPDSGLVELARGANLGDTGWQAGVDYTFKFQFTETNVKIYVDDVLELDVDGTFSDGRFAFYNFSQANVTYRGFERSALGPVALCRDVTVSAGSACEADASIDDGSYDPEGGEVVLSQSPPGPYPIGQTSVTLTVTSEGELSSNCTATVTVTEEAPPVITCPDDIRVETESGEVNRDDPLLASFVATATDNCDPDPQITDDAPQTFPTGETMVSFTATDESGNQATCTATVTVVSTAMTRVALDMHPGSCPNPLQVRKQGVVPAAVLGTGEFDVRDIDTSTLLLEGVAPLRWNYEDVSTPAGGDSCQCTTQGGDGYEDLTLKFSAPDVVEMLGEVVNGENRPLVLTGDLMDGTSFEATDCMVIRANGKGGGSDRAPGQGGDSGSRGDAPTSFDLSARGDGPVQTIRYSLPEAVTVRLTVYDVAGRVVKRLVSSPKPAGPHTLQWNTAGVPNGIYFYRLQAGRRVMTQKAALIR